MAAIEATTEITVTVNGEVLLRVPKMEPITPAGRSHFEKDGVSLEHLCVEHKPFLAHRTTCQLMMMRTHQHRRVEEEAVPGQVSADPAGPWPEALRGEKYRLVMVKRSTRLKLKAALKDKTSAGVKEATVDFELDMRRIWRYRSDHGGEFFRTLDGWLREECIVHTTTPWVRYVARRTESLSVLSRRSRRAPDACSNIRGLRESCGQRQRGTSAMPSAGRCAACLAAT